jgi:hypothetical protein
MLKYKKVMARKTSLQIFFGLTKKKNPEKPENKSKE